jgi:hypothetical protein
MKKSWKVALLALIVGAAITPNSRADQAFERLVSRWKVEREQVVRHITQAWLRGDSADSLRGDLMRLSQIESGLATEPGAFLYISGVENPNDTAGSIAAVARTYLKQRGAIVDSTEFLRGKTFNVYRERVLPKQVAKTQNYTYGGKYPVDQIPPGAQVETYTERKVVEIRQQ